MQPEVQYFLALLIAHVLADFPFQTRAMVAGKQAGSFAAYGRHLGVHLLVTLVALALFFGLQALSPRTLLTLAGLLLAHGVLDWTKSLLVNANPGFDGALLFVADQLLHVLLIVLAAWLMVPDSALGQPLIDNILSYRESVLVPAAIVLVTVFPSGYLIRYLLNPLASQLPLTDQDELSNAGLYLGWLERGLMTIAIAADSMGAVGIILGAKSIARFPEFKSRSFAEYFLIGTLLSVLFAFAGGLLIKLLV